MLKRKLGLLVAAAVMVGMFTSCVNVIKNGNGNDNQPAEEETPAGNGIDYNSYSSDGDYALIVENQTNLKLVAFKGTPSADTLLGGIPAGANPHYLKKNTSIFTKTGDFTLFIVKESDYLANKDDFAKLKTMPFTTFYAFYNTAAPNDTHFKISSIMGGEYKITLNNGTNYNVELRNMGVDKDIIGYCGGMSFETSFHVGEGEYMIFPVFKKLDKQTNEIFSTYPTYQTGQLAGQAISYEFTLGKGTTKKEALYNAADWVNGINFTPSAAYIKIINNADQGLMFFKGAGNAPEVTSAGGKRINPSESLVFPISMDLLDTNKYEEEKIIGGYYLGTNRISNIYLHGDATKTEKYSAGYLYTYTITGSAATNYIVTPLTNDGSEELKAQKVDWSKM